MSRTKRRNQSRRQLRVETLETRRVLAALPFGAADLDVGEFMLGRVAVTPVFLESDGTLDLKTETWTPAQINQVLTNIETGLDWWVDTLATQSAIHELEFVIDTTFASTPVSTKYEPIGRRSNDFSLWVPEFLAKQGFTTGNIELDIKSFNQAQRTKLETDWSYTIFVVPSFQDADQQFASGGSFSRAFAFAGGMFMVSPSTRPASTFTHETGHIFWARDEYSGGGSYLQRRGYYNTQNLNAADNPAPGFVQQPSIMASSTLLDTAYNNHVSPASTLAMIGWQDSDGDGIFDVLDVPHALAGTGYLESATGKYRFQGSAKVQTLANLNPDGLRNDITLNRIREIQVRFDSGNWQTVLAPNAYQLDLDLEIAVPSNASTIEIRAFDSHTTVESNIFFGRLNRADATRVSGINGFVWIDNNKNGLRDLAEYGPNQWQVSLVDAGGQPLGLQHHIEPDDYADGVIQSGFSNYVAISAVGTDTDGRVGIFSDSYTSTGTKNFRSFSRGSQTFLSNFNATSRKLQAAFNSPTNQVSIDAIGTSASSFGRLEAYNIGGQLLARYTTQQLAVGEVETMTIELANPEIAYVIASGHSNSNVRLDNLLFGPAAVTTTGVAGGFHFEGLPTGSYAVKVTPHAGFAPINPTGGLQQVQVVSGNVIADVDFQFQGVVSSWQNPVNRLDVNNDSLVIPLDVLIIINDLNAKGSRELTSGDTPAPPFIDVNGDGIVAPIDALIVINHLNSSGGGEGEKALHLSAFDPSTSADMGIEEEVSQWEGQFCDAFELEAPANVEQWHVDFSFLWESEEHNLTDPPQGL
ncbi:MAG: hypothetical protein KDB03_06255 [Planctomycetales bacterium]|nr:hypothetical protein [Planctomycetales bacterium]